MAPGPHLPEEGPSTSFVAHAMLLGVDNVQLRDVLRRLDPPARNAIRKVLIRDQEYRDSMASRLLEHATDQAASLAELIDMLTLNNDARGTVVRLLGELEADP